MALEMKVPSPGESITEVEIAQWLVQDGDYVEKDQAIAEVDSDKATLELPAEASGIITLKAEEGDAVAVGDVVCLIDTDAAKPDGGDEAAAKEVAEESKEATKAKDEELEQKGEEETSAKSDADSSSKPQEKSYASGTPSPAAKKILDEKGVDAKSVTGSGRDGRITKGDAVSAKASMGTPGKGSRGEDRKKLSMLRRRVAERLVSAKNDTAMLTTFNEVDMLPIFELRKQYKDEFKQKHGVSLGFMSFFSLAVVRALQLYPDVNSMIDGDYQIKYDFQDISIAVSGPKGLMVPVMRNVENMSFRGVEEEVKRLATRVNEVRFQWMK